MKLHLKKLLCSPRNQIWRWCRRNQDGGTDYFFVYIEFFYTLLSFLKLRNTKEMRRFFRGEEGLCKL
jgi:hypothetical protein